MLNKIKIPFKAVYEMAGNPKLLYRIVEDNSVWKKYIDKKHGKFSKGLPVVEINDLIPDFKETLEVVDFLGGGSTPLDLAIIKSLCRSFPNCRYFEIGTWRGQSISNVADVCSESYTLNLPDDAFGGIYRNLFGFFSKKNPKIKHVYGDSKTFDYAGLKTKFDVIFVDANHRYDFIKSDTEKVFKYLTHENSIVIWHDYGKDPATPVWETLAGILEGIPSGTEGNLYHVSNTLCAIHTNRKLPTSQLVSPAIPNKQFKVTMEYVKL
ncbi:MAG TPA: class I SAM-dependent methyltransferase [Bacteroidia bacterium]|jgi:hypothetical protein|nr:class I SAM-dependent methyltransferase [Bacteroidia bacterium]